MHYYDSSWYGYGYDGCTVIGIVQDGITWVCRETYFLLWFNLSLFYPPHLSIPYEGQTSLSSPDPPNPPNSPNPKVRMPLRFHSHSCSIHLMRKFNHTKFGRLPYEPLNNMHYHLNVRFGATVTQYRTARWFRADSCCHSGT